MWERMRNEAEAMASGEEMLRPFINATILSQVIQTQSLLKGYSDNNKCIIVTEIIGAEPSSHVGESASETDLHFFLTVAAFFRGSVFKFSTYLPISCVREI